MGNYISDFASEPVNRTSSYLKIESIEHQSKHVLLALHEENKEVVCCHPLENIFLKTGIVFKILLGQMSKPKVDLYPTTS